MSHEVDSWYSWVVVGVGFVMFFMNYGILQISGLFYSNIISYYHEDREQASMPFLLGSIARAIGGPVSGYLSHTFGLRFAVTLGCLLSTLGIFACSFAQNINVLYIFWFVHGFGYGMATSIYPRVINLFSKKHASKANGIATSGSSIAGMLLSPLTVVLLNSFGMLGTFLNLSGMMLNTIPAIMLLKDPTSKRMKYMDPKFLLSQSQKSMEDETFIDISADRRCHDAKAAGADGRTMVKINPKYSFGHRK
ncbi:hypothetical protein JTE90_027211 [Oedothorax gibbosus]|uniref:Major facilitator superfamily (MFS) profile domain-containing protein n=1 Tax=Oedothorax gibbosus TaxID=931172 RepID=A0AAV6U778_9ARAC|nr:hypothetical protein JTE90_027211 [Oedothorax gibbosus]